MLKVIFGQQGFSLCQLRTKQELTGLAVKVDATACTFD